MEFDQEFWNLGLHLAKASHLAYESEAEIEKTIAKWNYPQFKFFDEGTRGFIAANETQIIVSYRGSITKRDWKNNLKVVPTEKPYGKVHSGFLECFEDAREVVKATMEDFGFHDGKSIVFTGHSLGGAIGVLAAMELAGDSLNRTWIYTFGQPAVGDEKFQQLFDPKVAERAIRFVHDQDIVARLPPGYQHAGNLIFFNGKGEAFGKDGLPLGTDPGETRQVPVGLPELLSDAEFDARIEEIESALEEPHRGLIEDLINKIPAVDDHKMEHYIRHIEAKTLPETEELLEDLVNPSESRIAPGPVEIVSDSKAEEEENQSLGALPAAAPVEEEPVSGRLKTSPQEEWIDSPVTVHVVWSAHRKNDELCWRVAESLFSFLSHEPSGKPSLDSGAGLPVYAGFHYEKILKQLKNFECPDKAAVRNGYDEPCVVLVVLLEQEARIDPQFRKFWREVRDSERLKKYWPRVQLLPVALDRSWRGKQHDGELVFARSASWADEKEKVRLATWEVGVEICHFLAQRKKRQQPNPGDPNRERVRIFLSHAKANLKETDDFAVKLKNHFNSSKLKSFFDSDDVELGTSLDSQLAGAQEGAVLLSLRTDGYSESPFCQKEILTGVTEVLCGNYSYIENK